MSPAEFGGVQGGDRCANCQAPLASDQRYCVNCGERRGRSRFAADSFHQAPPPAPPPVAPPRRPRASSGATLVAGVATLLVALGVGVLIGHDSGNSTPKTVAASAPQIITVGGGGGSGSGSASSSQSKGKKSKSKPAKVVHVTKKVAAKATAAATKVLGGSKALAPATVQPGGACSNGQAGCQNGKFTGNFFGGG